MPQHVRRMAFVLLFVFLAATLGSSTVTAAAEPHPRLQHAITSVQAAIEYMQKAPHDFGGHRVAAIAACNEAINQLKIAIEYDHK
ncbi:MAG TPA: hypothetical protein VKY89_20655 [Thermoanaerobaculia bacterium]|jgi:hypothetical protein|nr:hypothetical protein [Thermoanaerobaculia bacterium]